VIIPSRSSHAFLTSSVADNGPIVGTIDPDTGTVAIAGPGRELEVLKAEPTEDGSLTTLIRHLDGMRETR
jgi:hypothetical protein